MKMGHLKYGLLCAALMLCAVLVVSCGKEGARPAAVDWCADPLAAGDMGELAVKLAQSATPCPVERAWDGKTMKLRLHLRRTDLRKVTVPLVIPWDDPSTGTRVLPVKWGDIESFATLEEMGRLRDARVARLEVSVPETVSSLPGPCLHGDVSIEFNTKLKTARAGQRSLQSEYAKAVARFLANPEHLSQFAAPALDVALNAPELWRPSGVFQTISLTTATECRIEPDKADVSKVSVYDALGHAVPLRKIDGGALAFDALATTSPYSAEHVYFVCEDGNALYAERSPAVVGAPTAEFITTTTLRQDSELFLKTDRFQSILDFRLVWHDFDKDPKFKAGFVAPANLNRGDVATTMQILFADKDTGSSEPMNVDLTFNGALRTRLAVDPATSSATVELPAGTLIDRNGLEMSFDRDEPGVMLDCIDLVYRATPGTQGSGTDAEYEALTAGNMDATRSVHAGETVRYFGTATTARLGTPKKTPPPVPKGNAVYITHSDFVPVLDKYVADKSAIVNVQDLYDYFSFGVETPLAIRDYLRYVLLTAKTPLDYAVLVGDCTVDYRGILDNGIGNFVPSMCVENSDGSKGASDRYFAELCGNDQLSDIFVGRLSVRSAADLENYFKKVALYNSPQAFTERPAAKSTMLFVADQEEQFEKAAAALQQELLPGYFQDTLKLADFTWIDNWYYPDALADRKQLKTSPDATKRLLQMFNSGSATIAYFGHGSPNIWSNERLWFGGESENSDNKLLRNANAFPFLTAFSCNVGAIDYPLERWNVCITEDMLRRENGGIIGAYVPSGPGLVDDHILLSRNIVQTLQAWTDVPVGGNLALGEWRFLSEVHGADAAALLRMYNLLGLPDLKLHLQPDAAKLKTLSEKQQSLDLVRAETSVSGPPGSSVTLHFDLRNPRSYPVVAQVELDGEKHNLPAFYPNETKTVTLSVPTGDFPGVRLLASVAGFTDAQKLPVMTVFGKQGKPHLTADLLAIDRLPSGELGALYDLKVTNASDEVLTSATVEGQFAAERFVWPVGTVPPGGTVSLSARVPFAQDDATTPLAFRLIPGEATVKIELGPQSPCDVTITSSSVTPISPTEGETFYFMAEVHNRGKSPARGVTVKLLDEKVTTNALLARGAPRQPSPFDLMPGETRKVVLRVDPFQNAGEQRVSCNVAAASYEKNVADNKAVQTFKVRTKARLRPSGMNLERTPDGQRALNVIVGVENRGESPAYGVMIQVFDADEKGQPINKINPIGEAPIPMIPPKARVEQTVRYDIPDSRPQGAPLRFTYEVYLKGSAQRVRPD